MDNFSLRRSGRAGDLSDLVLEFALRHQGMGARRGAATGAHDAGRQGRRIALVFWPIETLYRISLRIETLDVPSQDIITRDNVSVKVNAVCYFRVVDANLALSQVQNYLYATSQKAQTTLRSIVGQFELDEILAEREKVNSKLQIILDQDTEPWGIKVTKVEVKQVDIPGADAARHRPAGGGRARAPRQGHSRGGRIRSFGKAGRSRGSSRNPARRDPAPLSADADRNRRGEEHDDRVSAADRHHQCVGEVETHAGEIDGADGKKAGGDMVLGGRHLIGHFRAAGGDLRRRFHAGLFAGPQPVRYASSTPSASTLPAQPEKATEKDRRRRRIMPRLPPAHDRRSARGDRLLPIGTSITPRSRPSQPRAVDATAAQPTTQPKTVAAASEPAKTAPAAAAKSAIHAAHSASAARRSAPCPSRSVRR